MLRPLSLCICCAVLLLTPACRSSEEDSRVHADSPAPVQVGEENIVTAEPGEIVTGPLISGELRAAREATIRAEVSGTLLEVRIEEGEGVSRGALLGRIESRALEDMRSSARSAVQSAEAAVALARIEVQRNQELVAAGAIAQRDLDQARANLATAQAQLANARANLATAQDQLGDTVLRSPIAGIVSERFVDAGDVVSVGAELFTIIDPSSMRLEASVPSDEVLRLKAGLLVRFNIRGFEQAYEGRIERIVPQADPATRQVPIHVTIPNLGNRLVAGLFTEGRVITQSAMGIIVPADAVNVDDDQPWVLRVRDGVAERVSVTIGLRDDQTEHLQIMSGVSEGDTLLRGTAQAITPGTPVSIE
jgi:RND family efflux transporter MFP subunit